MPAGAAGAPSALLASASLLADVAEGSEGRLVASACPLLCPPLCPTALPLVGGLEKL